MTPSLAIASARTSGRSAVRSPGVVVLAGHAGQAPERNDGNVRIALKGLQDPAVPLRLSIVRYLRLVANLYRASSNRSSSNDLYLAIPANPVVSDYSETLSRLAAADPRWWEQCQINLQGLPVSRDARIDSVLRPFNHFVRCMMQTSL